MVGITWVCHAQVNQFTFYGVKAGLSSLQVTDVISDEHGYIWVTTYGAGISRFDGDRFINYHDPKTLGGQFYHTAFEGDGRLWFGGEGVLTSHTRGHWKFQKVAFDIYHGNTQCDGKILLGTSTGLAYISEDGEVILDRDLVGEAIYETAWHRDTLWAIAEAHLLYLDRDQWKTYTDLPQLNGPRTTFCVDSDDVLWLAGEQIGLMHKDGRAFKQILAADRLPNDYITNLTPGSLGTIYIGTSRRGLYVWQTIDALWQALSPNNSEPLHVAAMAYDPWDNAFLAGRGSGLVKYASQHFVSHEALSGSTVRRLKPEDDGATIYLTNGKMDRIAGTEIRAIDDLVFTEDETLQVSLHSTNGQEWFGTSRGLYLRKSEVVLRVVDTTFEDLLTIHDMLMLDTQQLLVTAEQGTYLLEDISCHDSSEMASVRMIFLCQEYGEQLLCTDSLVWLFGQRYLAYLHKDQLSAGPTQVPLGEVRLTNATRWNERGLMVASREGELYFIDETVPDIVVPFPGNSALPIDQVRSMALHDGKLWISTRNSIIQLTIHRDLSWSAVEELDVRHGLPNVEFIQTPAYVDKEGHVFFATARGILELLPEVVNTRTFSGPRLFVRSISCEDEEVTAGWETMGGFTVPYEKRDISISLQAVDQNYPLDLRYQWKLEEGSTNNDWVTPSRSGMVNLVSLSPGTYDFIARSSNRVGALSRPVSFSFQIEKPIWMMWWFWTIPSLGIFIFSMVIYRWRMGLVVASNHKRTIALEQKNSRLKLEQSALRLQMNPHFIFNVLQSIQAKVMTGTRDQARKDIQDFSFLMRSFLDHSRHDLITLEDEIAGLTRYLEVERSLQNRRFDYTIALPKDLDPSFYKLPPMLIQPFLENAIKHGMPEKNVKGMIHLSFRWKGKYLVCEIRDLGTGWDLARLNEESGSAGISITRDRLKSYLNQTSFDPLSIEKVTDEYGNSKGTCVRIILPLSE